MSRNLCLSTFLKSSLESFSTFSLQIYSDDENDAIMTRVLHTIFTVRMTSHCYGDDDAEANPHIGCTTKERPSNEEARTSGEGNPSKSTDCIIKLLMTSSDGNLGPRLDPSGADGGSGLS